MRMRSVSWALSLSSLALLLTAMPSQAVVFDVTVDGPDAIFLAGRTDVVIPAANLPWTGPGTHLLRHGGATPEEALESVPSFIPVAGGDIVRALDAAEQMVESISSMAWVPRFLVQAAMVHRAVISLHLMELAAIKAHKAR